MVRNVLLFAGMALVYNQANNRKTIPLFRIPRLFRQYNQKKIDQENYIANERKKWHIHDICNKMITHSKECELSKKVISLFHKLGLKGDIGRDMIAAIFDKVNALFRNRGELLEKINKLYDEEKAVFLYHKNEVEPVALVHNDFADGEKFQACCVDAFIKARYEEIRNAQEIAAFQKQFQKMIFKERMKHHAENFLNLVALIGESQLLILMLLLFLNHVGYPLV